MGSNKVVTSKNVGPIRAAVGATKPSISSKSQVSTGIPVKAGAGSTATPLSNPASSWAALVKRSDPVTGADTIPENNVHLDDTVIIPVNHNSPPSNLTASTGNNTIPMPPVVETRSARSASEGGGNIFVDGIYHSTGSNFANQSGYSSEPNLSSGLLQHPQSARIAPVELSPQQQQQMMSAKSPQQYGTTTPNIFGTAPTSGYPPVMNLPPMQQQQIQMDNSIFGAAAGGNLNPAAASFNFKPDVSYPSQQHQTYTSFPSKPADVAPFWNGGSGAGLGYPTQPPNPSYHQQTIWNNSMKGSSNGDSNSMNNVKNNSDSSGAELDDILMMPNFNGLNMLDQGESGNGSNFF